MDIYGNEAYNIRCTLERMNYTFQQMLGVMSKPENRFAKVLKYVMLLTGALGFLHVVELVRQWIIGG